MASGALTTVGLDGDDTLWHCEVGFRAVEERFVELLDRHIDVESVSDRLLATERANLARFGYGVKSFTLSMVETAIELTDRTVTAAEIHEIIDLGKWLLDHPVDLLPGVADTVARLEGDYRLLLVTKGDLLHQESKVAASGLADHFQAVEIVSEKDPDTYRRVLARHGVTADQFVMVGNSLRSDVLPVIEIGGRGVQIPHEIEWAVEAVDEPVDAPCLGSIAQLPGWLADQS